MPTIRGIPGPYRLYFYSFDCNEPKHVHVQRERMTCKFWLEPVAFAANDGFPAHELNLSGFNSPSLGALTFAVVFGFDTPRLAAGLFMLGEVLNA